MLFFLFCLFSSSEMTESPYQSVINTKVELPGDNTIEWEVNTPTAVVGGQKPPITVTPTPDGGVVITVPQSSGGHLELTVKMCQLLPMDLVPRSNGVSQT